MYHLTKSLYLWATSKEEYSVLLLGLDNAGKTTFLNTLKSLYSTSPSQPSNPAPSAVSTLPLNPKPTAPTVGQNVSTLNLPDMYLKIWDVGGQEGLRGLWNSYYDVCHAIVFVVDGCDVGDDNVHEDDNDDDGHDRQGAKTITRKPSMHGHGKGGGRLDEARVSLLSVLSHPSTASIPLLVLANKQDREDCVETVRIKEGLVRRVFESEQGSGVRDSRVLPVSALKGDGVVEAVKWVRTRVRWNFRDGGREPVRR